MLLKRMPKTEGICFAWTPKLVPEGNVWLEWVHFRSIGKTRLLYEYARWIPEKRYNAGERRRFTTDDPAPTETWEQEQARLFRGPLPEFYRTPPVIEKCRALMASDRNRTAACWYPHCTCMDLGGSRCPSGITGFTPPDDVDAENGR